MNKYVGSEVISYDHYKGLNKTVIGSVVSFTTKKTEVPPKQVRVYGVTHRGTEPTVVAICVNDGYTDRSLAITTNGVVQEVINRQFIFKKLATAQRHCKKLHDLSLTNIRRQRIWGILEYMEINPLGGLYAPKSKKWGQYNRKEKHAKSLELLLNEKY
jgi:hypothetical protein